MRTVVGNFGVPITNVIMRARTRVRSDLLKLYFDYESGKIFAIAIESC